VRLVPEEPTPLASLLLSFPLQGAIQRILGEGTNSPSHPHHGEETQQRPQQPRDTQDTTSSPTCPHSTILHGDGLLNFSLHPKRKITEGTPIVSAAMAIVISPHPSHIKTHQALWVRPTYRFGRYTCTCGTYVFRFQCGHQRNVSHVCGRKTGMSGRPVLYYHPAIVIFVDHVVLQGGCNFCQSK